MIYEYRVYEAVAGRLPDLHRRFEDHTLRLFERHGFRVVGLFTWELGEPSDQLVYILAFDDLAHRERSWAAFSADPEWQAAKTNSELNGPLVARIRSSILKPTAYSPEP